MNKVFILNGLPESGKTLFGHLLGEKLEDQGINFLHTSSIDPIKELLMPESGWPEEFRDESLSPILNGLKREVTERDWDGETKDDYWRRTMSQLKAKLLDFNPNFVHSWVLSRILKKEEPLVALVDIREIENIEGFRRYCTKESPNLVVRSVLIESDMGLEFNNRSDNGREVLNYSYDIHVVNNRKEHHGDTEKELDAFRSEVDLFVERHVLMERISKEKE